MSNEYLDWLNDLKNEPEGSPDHNRWLCILCPWLCPYNVVTGELPIDYDYEYTWLDNMPKGWKKAFGEQMCFEIKSILEKYDLEQDYRIIDIKEKWGQLCWYDNNILDIEPLHKIINKYENLSKETCTFCGKKASTTTDGWIIPVCDECYDEFENKRKI